MKEMDNWKPKVMIIGTLIGSAIGALAAYMLIQNAEEKQEQPKLSAGDGVKIGVGVMGLLRMMSDFGQKE
jgi:hypothetical protein